MTNKLNLNAVPLNEIKKFVKANVNLQCKQLAAPRLAIQGAPGTGKSDIIREICEENGWILSVKYLSNMSLEQITGIPCKVESGSTAIWTMPELFNFENSEYVPDGVNINDESAVKILLIDDFHLADRIMQRYLFQLLTYKSLNGYKLSKNTAILLAGNRNTDRALANPIPAPVCNRLMFMEVKSDVTDWLNNFAFKNNIRADIISYLYNVGDIALSTEPLESGAWASPRAWTYLSYQLDAYEAAGEELKMEDLKNIATGLVGTEQAGAFIAHRELFAKWNFDKLFKSGLEKAKTAINKDVVDNVTNVYSLISAGCAWWVNKYKENNFSVDTNKMPEYTNFLYEIFIHMMLFPDNYIRKNSRPLLASGMKYIHMYQNSMVEDKKTTHNLLRAFVNCMQQERDCDYIFMDLIGTIFEIPFDEKEREKIEMARNNLNYDLW